MQQKKHSIESDTTKGAMLLIDSFSEAVFIGRDNEGFHHSLMKADEAKKLWMMVAKVVADEVEDDERVGLKYEMIASAIIFGLSIALPEQYDTELFQAIITKARQNRDK